MWLSDRDMSAARTILRRQFSGVGGFCKTFMGEFPGQFPKGETKKWLQIMHGGINHWILAGYGFESMPEDTVCVYDSNKNGKPTDLVVSCCASILQSTKENFKIRTMAVQQQEYNDCGGFVIAFPTALLQRKHPRRISFEPKKLVSNLKICLTNQIMTLFPLITETRIPTLRYEETWDIPLFCSCRRPAILKGDQDEWMAQCKTCKQWFHPVCENFPDNAKTKKFRWCCTKCIVSHV